MRRGSLLCKIVILAALARTGGVLADDTTAHFSAAASAYAEDVVIENAKFRLTVGGNAVVKSLVMKKSGEELVDASSEIPLFTSVQERFWDDELKMIHPNRRRTLRAASLRRDGNRLEVGFEFVPYRAFVELKETAEYVSFRLDGFTTNYYDHCNLHLDKPPVDEFGLVRIPVKNRKYFGDLLNVSWDEQCAVGVVATSLFEDIDHEERPGMRILSATLKKNIRMKGGEAAIVVAEGREPFLDAIDRIERDYDLPRGVASRRGPHLNGSIYHPIGVVSPDNLDEHLRYAGKGGFRYFCVSTEAMTAGDGEWGLHGDYDWLNEFSGREEDLKALIGRIKSAGMIPGLHFLSTHVGLKSRYVTPVADARLNLRRHFTLCAAIPAEGEIDEIRVQEPTTGSPRADGVRILKFGGELFSYEGYSESYPWKFTKVKRGAHKTRAAAHPRGEIGGVLDVSEYGTPTSCYLDPDTDLLDEISAKIAHLYNCGFEFVYFDGAEGVKPPYNYHVARAQYVQWKLFAEKPVFCEGAAKSHFSWHMLSGANAFDCFTPDVFKAGTAAFPLKQAPIAWQDMTRCNFGWWFPFAPKEDAAAKDASGVQPDHWEYGCALSFAWDCPTTVFGYFNTMRKHSRMDDLLETMRRWEQARRTQPFTAAEKEALKNPDREHHLLKRADGSLKLVEYRQVPLPDSSARVRAFEFEAEGAVWLVYWRELGEGEFALGLPADRICLLDEYEGRAVPFRTKGNGVVLPAGPRRYLRTTLSRAELLNRICPLSSTSNR